jgi:hypothetical protein
LYSRIIPGRSCVAWINIFRSLSIGVV